MQTAKQLCDQALQLPPEERMALVDQILDTLDERDSALDAQWAQEAQSFWWLTAEVRFKPSHCMR